MNLKRIKDAKFNILGKLIKLLTSPEQVEDSTPLCDDILIAQNIAGISDEQVIELWDDFTSHEPESESMQNDFQDYLSEELDKPESLDKTTYDYCMNTGINFADAVLYLNSFLSVNDKVRMCNLITESNLV